MKTGNKMKTDLKPSKVNGETRCEFLKVTVECNWRSKHAKKAVNIGFN